MLLTIRFMRRQDISQVTEIDHDAFPTEWPPTNFPRELDNKLAYYIVACETDNSTPQTDSKSSAREIQPGILSRVRSFFVRSPIPKEAPVAEDRIVGFAGMWQLSDEAHITSIASHKDHRHQGIGEALLISLIDMAIANKARIVTLEARVSNQIAQNLYYKFSFDKLGVRKAYYLDNKEDAVIMSTEYIGSPSFHEKFTQVKKAFLQKWGTFDNQISAK